MAIRKAANQREWDGTRVVIKPGTYRFKITDVKGDLDKESIALKVVTFEITGDEKGNKSQFNGATVQGRYPEDGAGASRSLQLAKAFGVPIPEGEAEIDFDPGDYVGKELIGTIENNKSSKDPERIYNNIVNERPLPAPKAQTASADVAEKLKGDKKAS
jgi:hypothetical protein